MPKTILTQEYLKEILEYNPETGMFIWKIEKARRVATNDIAGTKWKNHNGTSYLHISIDYNKYRAHRLAWLYMTGEFPVNQVDHKDGNGLNNKWDNIRSVSQSENMKNLPLRKDNKSGVCGVSFDKEFGKWVAYISANNKIIKIGRFKDIWDAICARKSAEYKYGYYENHGKRRDILCQA